MNLGIRLWIIALVYQNIFDIIIFVNISHFCVCGCGYITLYTVFHITVEYFKYLFDFQKSLTYYWS